MSIRIEPHTIWLVAGVAVGLAVLWVVVSRGLPVLILLFIAIVFAEGIRPLVDWMGRLMPRALAILLIYLVLVLIAGILIWLLAQPVLSQATLLIDHLPDYISRLQHLVKHAEQGLGSNVQFSHQLQRARADLLGFARSLIPRLIHLPLLLFGLFFEALTILFMAYFWLTAVHRLKGFVVGLFPPEAQAEASETIAELSRKLGGYVRGVAVNMVLAGIVVWIALTLLGVPYAILLGVVAGLTNLIPIVGTYIAAISGIGVALLAGGLLKAGEVWVFYIVFQQLQGAVIQTYIMRETVKLNQLTTLFATLLGGAILGVVGAVIAVPVAVIVEVMVRRALAPAVRRATGAAGRTSRSQA